MAGIFCIDARLDGVSAHGDVILRDRQLFTGRDPYLLFDEVDAGDHFSDGVFDLQSGVHLHEEELVGPVGGHDELDGACAGVINAACRVAGRRADACPGCLVEQR